MADKEGSRTDDRSPGEVPKPTFQPEEWRGYRPVDATEEPSEPPAASSGVSPPAPDGVDDDS